MSKTYMMRAYLIERDEEIEREDEKVEREFIKMLQARAEEQAETVHDG